MSEGWIEETSFLVCPGCNAWNEVESTSERVECSCGEEYGDTGENVRTMISGAFAVYLGGGNGQEPAN